MVCDWLLWLRCHLKSFPPVALSGISFLKWTLSCISFQLLMDIGLFSVLVALCWRCLGTWFIWTHVFISCRHRIAGSYGNSVPSLSETAKALVPFISCSTRSSGGVVFWFTMRIVVVPPATWGVRVLPEATMEKQNKTLYCPNKTSLASFSPWLLIWIPCFGKLESGYFCSAGLF